MIKRKKDGGFTLIELMIVIAVIGILAVVLAPKMTGVKDSAKATGAITNAKSVEAYVTANIDQWDRTGSATVISTIRGQFIGGSAPNQLVNPIDKNTTAIEVDDTLSGTFVKGMVTVEVNSPLTSGIEIKAYGNTVNDIVFTTTISPN